MEIGRAAALLANNGATILLVAVSYRLDATGGVAALAITRLVATIVFAPLGSLLGDRYDRRFVIAGADAARVLFLLGIAAATAWTSSLALVLVLFVGMLAVGYVSAPARAAILPGLAATSERLTAANVVASATDDVSSLVGPALAGVALGVTSIGSAFVATAIVAAVGPIFVAMIGTPEAKDAGEAEDDEGPRQGVLAGFRALLKTESARALLLVYAVISFVGGALTILFAVTAIRLLGLGSSGVGYLFSFFSGGALLGTIMSMLLIRRGLESAVLAGTTAWGLPLIVVGLWPRPAVAFVLFVLAGAGDTVAGVAAVTLLQRVIPDDVLSRSFGALEFFLGATAVLGSVAAPLVVSAVGVRGALLAFGAVIPLAAVPAGLRLRRTARPAPEALAFLERVAFLAPLSAPALEQLAEAAEEVHVPTDAIIFREGAGGDRFYVVRDGSVELASNGRTLARETAGGSFGEIALLRNTPRTATATARSDTDLYAIDGAEFVAALTGSVKALEDAEALVTRRLAVTA